jgi:hypothetical protein
MANGTIAVKTQREDIGDSITLVDANSAGLREYPLVRPKHKILRHQLSFDGEAIAFLRSDHRVEVDHLFDPASPSVVTRVGGFAMEARMTVGAYCVFLHLGKGGLHWHLFDWSSGTLEHFFERDPMRVKRAPGASPPTPGNSRFFGHAPLSAANALELPKCCAQDSGRYLAGLKRSNWYVLDRFGQIAVLDENENLIAMFAGFRDHFAAWLPDGTRFGRLTLNLGPATPDAAKKIGQTLLRAGRS